MQPKTKSKDPLEELRAMQAAQGGFEADQPKDGNSTPPQKEQPEKKRSINVDEERVK